MRASQLPQQPPTAHRCRVPLQCTQSGSHRSKVIGDWLILALAFVSLLAPSWSSAQDNSAPSGAPIEASSAPPALTVAGAGFPETLSQHGTALTLVNAAQLRYKFVFRPYVASLYLPAGIEPKDFQQDVAKAIHIHYLWNLEAKDIGPAGQQVIARTHTEAQMAALAARLNRFDASYQDVAPGDTYTLFYLPNRGTTLALNGTPLVTIPGADFAAAYFSIWLGADPVEKNLRRDLMRQRKAR